ncbi:MAG: hypothetical protein NT076_00495, partial [Candidatus Pacearchaeota archaeon]|nr:hypothetical protein [Candidatus Pacearchaeota archaeon]
LIDLKKKGLIKNARSEGFTGSYTRDELREFYNHRLDAVLRIGCYDDEISNGNSESFRYIPTAPLILAAAGLLEILPGAKDTKPLGQTEEYWAFDGREDFTLDLIDKAEEPYSVLIFGSLHAFGGKQSCGKDYNEADRTSYKDNILGRKFSLIELFPEHVSLK